MGSIGPAEILVVLVVALLVLGPSRLPDAARSIGRALSELRRFSSGMQAEVREAFSAPPDTEVERAPAVREPPASEPPPSSPAAPPHQE